MRKGRSMGGRGMKERKGWVGEGGDEFLLSVGSDEYVN